MKEIVQHSTCGWLMAHACFFPCRHFHACHLTPRQSPHKISAGGSLLFMRCVSLTLTGLVSAWRRGEAPLAILAKPLSDCVTLFCLRQCKSRHLNVCEIKKKKTCNFQTNWIFCILNWGVRCDVVSDAGHTCCCCSFLLLTFAPSNWRTSLTTASANKYSSLIQAMISFIFVEIYAPKVTVFLYFSVFCIERTWWIKSLQSKSYLRVFLSSVMRWVMILWWFASKKTLVAEILIWRVTPRLSGCMCPWLLVGTNHLGILGRPMNDLGTGSPPMTSRVLTWSHLWEVPMWLTMWPGWTWEVCWYPDGYLTAPSIFLLSTGQITARGNVLQGSTFPGQPLLLLRLSGWQGIAAGDHVPPGANGIDREWSPCSSPDKHTTPWSMWDDYDPCRGKGQVSWMILDRMEILTHSTTVQHIQIHSNTFSWLKMYDIRLRFDWSLFPISN